MISLPQPSHRNVVNTREPTPTSNHLQQEHSTKELFIWLRPSIRERPPNKIKHPPPSNHPREPTEAARDPSQPQQWAFSDQVHQSGRSQAAPTVYSGLWIDYLW